MPVFPEVITQEYIADSQTYVHKTLVNCGVTIVSVIGVCGLIAISPLIGMYKGAVFIEQKITDSIARRKHEKRMGKHWKYRLEHSAPRVSALRKWEDYMNDTQWQRALVQIEEADDIPYEVWCDLIDVDPDKWVPRAKLVGLEEYDDIKNICVREALAHYTRKNKTFTTKCE